MRQPYARAKELTRMKEIEKEYRGVTESSSINSYMYEMSIASLRVCAHCYLEVYRRAAPRGLWCDVFDFDVRDIARRRHRRTGLRAVSVRKTAQRLVLPSDTFAWHSKE